MRILSAIANRLFSTDVKLLMKAGLINGDNDLTEKAVEFLEAVIAQEHHEELVDYAKQILEEEKAQKSK